MNDSLTPPRERDLPNHERRRAELMALITTPRTSTKRRVVVPFAAAASVVALTAGGAIAAQSWQSRVDVTPQGGSDSTSKPTPTQRPRTDIRPAPPVRDLTRQERAQMLDACTQDVPDAEGFEPLLGVRFPNEEREPNTFLVAVNGTTRFECAAYPDGEIFRSGTFGDYEGRQIPYLFAPVDGKDVGFGMYTGPVAKVTVQRRGEAERTAVLRDGYWFYPDDGHHELPDRIAPEDGPAYLQKMADRAVIGVAEDITLRGYESDGGLLYDSSENGPSVKDCYTDPEGEQVLLHNGVGNGHPDPDDCRRTFEWQP